jgi:hypothetical protein
MVGAVALLLAARAMMGPSEAIDGIEAAFAGGTVCRGTIATDARKAVERFRAGLEQGNFAVADIALPEARAALEQAALCFPARSDIWLVLARIEALEAGVTPRLSRLVGMSCSAAPTQSWTARDRLRMFGHLAGALDASARACLEKDRTLLAQVDDAGAR